VVIFRLAAQGLRPHASRQMVRVRSLWKIATATVYTGTLNIFDNFIKLPYFRKHYGQTSVFKLLSISLNSNRSKIARVLDLTHSFSNHLVITTITIGL
jgi:hypothetical protein